MLIKVDDINQGGYATPDNMARTIYDITAAIANKETIVRLGDARANAGFAGARGVRRFGTQELESELTALSKIASHRPSLKLAIPFVTSVEEIRNAKDALARHGLSALGVGVVIETPAAVSIVDKLAEQASFVLVDADHLTELMLAVDKSNAKLRHLYNVKHDAVYNAIGGVLKICKGKNVPVYVCGTATAQADFKQFLTDKGADGIFEEAKDFNSSDDSFGSSVLGW